MSLCNRDLERSIEKVLLEAGSNDPLFKDIKVDCISTFCQTLVLTIRPNGLWKAVVCMRSYGIEYHNPFEAKISQVVHAILAALRVLPPLNINGISYVEASEWSNPIMEAMNEASHI
jgi:hypothetical protein